MAKYRSQGRKEQLLLTDQDNALVFQDVGVGMMRLKIFYSFSGKCNAYVKYCGV
jgi:signal-transduction protein with cAMP-binding, CBS, and nucleotidyltransferase domain